MRYFWVLTLIWPTANGPTSRTDSGTINIPNGATREETFEEICNFVRDRGQVPSSTIATVTFFSLEPDELKGGR